MGGHTLWTRDRETYWTLGGLFYRRRGRARPEPGTHRRGRYTITIGLANLPYGRSVGKSVTHRTVTHISDRIGIAWLGGRPVGAMALWICGAVTTEFRLSQDIESRWCPTCWYRVHPEGVGITIHNLHIDNRSS